MIQRMDLVFRKVDKENIREMRFIAEADSRIPLEYDPTYIFNESSIETRLEFYKNLSDDDFFEVVVKANEIVAFHIVKKIPYPPNFHIGNIITSWVHPDYRGQGFLAKLKTNAESWAKKSKLIFMQTNVHKDNVRMLNINEKNGFESAFICMRKRL